jgi:hypothetical protein
MILKSKKEIKKMSFRKITFLQVRKNGINSSLPNLQHLNRFLFIFTELILTFYIYHDEIIAVHVYRLVVQAMK